MTIELTYARRWSVNRLSLSTPCGEDWAAEQHDNGQAYAVTRSIDGNVGFALSVTGMFGFVSVDHLETSGSRAGTVKYKRDEDGLMSVSEVAIPMDEPQDGDKVLVFSPDQGEWTLTARPAHRREPTRVDAPAVWNDTRPAFPEFGQYDDFCDPSLLDFDLDAVLATARPV